METTKVCKKCGQEFQIHEFQKNLHGYTNVCRYCANAKRRETRKKNKEREAVETEKEINCARMLRLKDFTPRELMEELVRRGYNGTLTYTRIEKIDLANI